MWTATVVQKKEDAKGQLTVGVEFIRDGDGKVVREDYVTSQGQAEGWLQEQVNRKLKDLEAVAATVVPEVGAVIQKLPDPTPEPSGDAQREAYAADIARYNQYLSAIRIGVKVDKVQDFIDLKQRLADNFQPDYLDLF